ncbi:hypothetical protein AAFC00_004729 [Neodothiora populina]|uniref:Ubiquinone biosynthesis O-methyltransferase, mitochondrial n=1 Tax=Neodothiora populina TaxID=2781224 RepID=A0ABR3P3A3_9PEZI
MLSRALRVAVFLPSRRIVTSYSTCRCFTTTARIPSGGPASTVSETEMSHFSSLASSWWDPHGPSRILHLMNPLRHTFIQRCKATTNEQQQPTQSKLKYLDIGCGGGIFAESAARLPTTESVVAIDPTSQVLAVARQHQRTDPTLMEPGRLTYLNTAIENLPVPTDARAGVDVLSLFEVIEHIEQPGPFLEHCLPHVKPGGWLIMSTMSRTWTSWATTIFAAEDLMGVVPKGTHNWNQYINVDEMKAWAAKQKGWSQPVTMGVVYVPGVGWKEVNGSASWGNYFFGIRRDG